MITLRPAIARGQADHGWLKSAHTFSFANYYDPNHMGFGALRVINEDRVDASRGFPPHSHRDMEIISYVLDGELEHQDSMGNRSIIRPGEVQRMTAGTGVTHSEYNPSKAEGVHFLQIWIVPERQNVEPGYEQKEFAPDEKRGQFRLVASRDGRSGSVTVHQDVNVYATIVRSDESIEMPIASERKLWVQVVRGSLNVNGNELSEGDAAALDHEETLQLVGTTEAEVLVFDLVA